MGGLHAGALGLLVELDDVEPDGLAQRAATNIISTTRFRSNRGKIHTGIGHR